jgi:hypothetical protein
VWWLKYYRNGKAYRESSKTTKVEDAKKLLKLREGEIAKGKIPGIYFDRIKFDEIAEDFLTDYNLNNRKSMERATISTNRLKDAFSGMRVPEITTPHIQAYIKRRLEGEASHATVNRELAALKRMLNLGARQTPPKVDRVIIDPEFWTTS